MQLQGGSLELLDRPFRVFAFDWDGSAVPDRTADATDLVRSLESVLRHGVLCCIITGTNLAHMERQCTHALSPAAKRNLYVCTNRGSEVYAFSEEGDTERVYLRVASESENAALDRAAIALKQELTEAGVESDVIFDRLNRRKIDEIGLTDKGDSVLWLRDNVIGPRRIPAGLILIGGDEFGPIGGAPGSDSLRVPGLEGSVYVSVGKEPNGVPSGVTPLGGGPARFVALLRARTRAPFDRRAGSR